LCEVASRLLSNESRDHFWQAQDLVHEAFLRIARSRTTPDFQSSSQLVGLAVVVMRHILIDRTRSTGISARHRRVSLEQDLAAELSSPWKNISLHLALERLAAVNAGWFLVVQLRFFEGLEVDEIASALAVCPRTVKRYWRAAQIWLHQALKAGTMCEAAGSNLPRCNSETALQPRPQHHARHGRKTAAAHDRFRGLSTSPWVAPRSAIAAGGSS